MNNQIIKIFVGFDNIESIAWHTFVHSILRHSSRPIAIIPVNLSNLKSIFSRKRDSKQSNEFSLSRFLVPFLCDYKGFGIFFDCDMLLRTDITEIFEVVEREPGKAVYVVKHDYESNTKIKFLNKKQYNYPRKNWSSVVLWNCSHPANLIVTSDYVNTATPKELHRFSWLTDEQIGELDVRWNWLVGEYRNPPSNVKNVHWTLGGPYFKEYMNVDFSEEWFEEVLRVNFCKQRTD